MYVVSGARFAVRANLKPLTANPRSVIKERVQMTKFLSSLFLSALLIFPGVASAETIVTHEVEKYFYKDGKIEKFEGQFENTYYLDREKNILTRTRIYDFQTKKITPDETSYQIETTLRSHPANAPYYSLAPLIRAIGRPDGDTVQIVMIDDHFVTTCTSTADTYVLSRATRLKTPPR